MRSNVGQGGYFDGLLPPWAHLSLWFICFFFPIMALVFALAFAHDLWSSAWREVLRRMT